MSQADRSLMWFMFSMLVAFHGEGLWSLVMVVFALGWFCFYLVEDREEKAKRR